MTNDLKLGSLFDGSGGFPLAGSLCGITPVWASEVEPYPIAVTRSRFPGMKHLGDISKIFSNRVISSVRTKTEISRSFSIHPVFFIIALFLFPLIAARDISFDAEI